jgi:hypothetical protein
MKEKTQDEIGKYFLDISKYVATAILISTFLGEFNQKWAIYVSGFLFAATFFLAGTAMLNNNKKNK